MTRSCMSLRDQVRVYGVVLPLVLLVLVLVLVLVLRLLTPMLSLGLLSPTLTFRCSLAVPMLSVANAKAAYI